MNDRSELESNTFTFILTPPEVEALRSAVLRSMHERNQEAQRARAMFGEWGKGVFADNQATLQGLWNLFNGQERTGEKKT